MPNSKTWSAAAAAIGFCVITRFAHAQLRAFGEADGLGSTATGARASTTPTIYHVTNLNDAGSGSFRDAVSASNRIVVFDVGGIVNLKSAVSCKSNLTIAGQTAPGGGISLNGAEVSFSSQSNVICRYLRFRPGDGSSSSDDGVAMYDSKNIILDHASIEFAKYDNIDAVTDNGADPNITIQNSVIADGIGQQFGAHLEAVGGHFTVVNNLWANNHNRNPLAKVDDQFVDNVEYNNEASYTTHTSTPFKHDIVNNTFIYGPATSGNTFYQLSSGDTDYATGNIQDSNKNGALDGLSISPGTGTQTSTPNFATTASLPTLTTADAYTFVLAHAGANITRDELDNLVLNQVKSLGTAGPSGGLYTSANSDGLSNTGLGTTAAGSRAVGFDADNDGVADAWEAVHGMSAGDAGDALKLNPLGYFMIEQYLNELGSTNDSQNSIRSGDWGSPTTWGSGVVPGAMDYALIRGAIGSPGSVTLASGSFTAMKVSIGGSASNSFSSGETLTVSGSGSLSVYDTIAVGDQNAGTLNIGFGSAVSADNIILGNTLSGVTTTGVLNLTSGTLSLSQLVLGGGKPNAWTSGGTFNLTGGTVKAIGTLKINVPLMLGGAGGTFDSNGNNGTISSVIGNATGSSAGLTKVGAGTITLTGKSTYSGTTTVRAGTLVVDGSLIGSAVSVSGGTFGGTGTLLSIATASGTVTPGDGGVGKLTVLGNASLTATTLVEMNGAASGSADQISVAGSLTLGGTLTLSTVGGGTAPDDKVYVIATYGLLNGQFSTINGMPSGYGIDYHYNDGTGANHVAIVLPEPGSMLLVLPAILHLRRRRAARV